MQWKAGTFRWYFARCISLYFTVKYKKKEAGKYAHLFLLKKPINLGFFLHRSTCIATDPASSG